MDRIVLKAHAKLNLYLDIISKRPDGYHGVDTLMLALGLSDRVSVEKRHGDITLVCEDPSVPVDCRNIAYKAALSFFEKSGIRGGCSILIEKNIPKEAGMGGGSSDGAAVIRGLNLLYGRPLDTDGEMACARMVGADLPFFLGESPKLMTGLGDEPVSGSYPLPAGTAILIIKPSEGISTPVAYGAIDRHFPEFVPHKDKLDSIGRALNDGNASVLVNNLYNIFEEILPDVCPVCCDILGFMRQYAAGAGLCGSGSAVYGIFPDRRCLSDTAVLANEKYPDAKIFITLPVCAGLEQEVQI